jgi:hypothetical protein
VVDDLDAAVADADPAHDCLTSVCCLRLSRA